MMIGMQLCLTHEEESQKQSILLNYLSNHLGGKVMFSNMRPLTTEEMLEQTCEILKVNFNCTIMKVVGETVTARRPSGITVVIRHQSPSNYAYIIMTSEGKQLSGSIQSIITKSLTALIMYISICVNLKKMLSRQALHTDIFVWI